MSLEEDYEFVPRKFCPKCRFKPCRCDEGVEPSLWAYDVPSINHDKTPRSANHHYAATHVISSPKPCCACFFNPLTISARWKQRRQSVRELRSQDESIRAEYNRLKELEQRMRESQPIQPPQYDDVQTSSGESVVGMDSGRLRVLSVGSSQGSIRSSTFSMDSGRSRMSSVAGSQTTCSSR